MDQHRASPTTCLSHVPTPSRLRLGSTSCSAAPRRITHGRQREVHASRPGWQSLHLILFWAHFESVDALNLYINSRMSLLNSTHTHTACGDDDCAGLAGQSQAGPTDASQYLLPTCVRLFLTVIVKVIVFCSHRNKITPVWGQDLHQTRAVNYNLCLWILFNIIRIICPVFLNKIGNIPILSCQVNF